jgi:hypothetical protein
MRLSDFIKKLGAFPLDDIARLYCPVDRKYYYIYTYEIRPKKIIIVISQSSDRYYYTYRRVIESFTGLVDAAPNFPVTFVRELGVVDLEYQVVNSETGT